MNYWMVTISDQNFKVTRQQGWRFQGFTRSQRRKTDRMQPGDRLLFYVQEPRGFGLTAIITAPAFQGQNILWRSHRPDETFPCRVRIRPEVTLSEGQYAEAAELAPRLEYLRRWPPERWPLAFIGELHLLPRRDFELIEGEMRRLRGEQPAEWRPERRFVPGPAVEANGPPSGDQRETEAPEELPSASSELE
jgi:hypothetical protein